MCVVGCLNDTKLLLFCWLQSVLLLKVVKRQTCHYWSLKINKHIPYWQSYAAQFFKEIVRNAILKKKKTDNTHHNKLHNITQNKTVLVNHTNSYKITQIHTKSHKHSQKVTQTLTNSQKVIQYHEKSQKITQKHTKSHRTTHTFSLFKIILNRIA